MRRWEFFVYITTNSARSVLYVGCTNDLAQRLVEHYLNRGKPQTFAGRYYCHNLIYVEVFRYVKDALAREKEIKGWKREKKDALILLTNPQWDFLNNDVIAWPPAMNEKVMRGGKGKR